MNPPISFATNDDGETILVTLEGVYSYALLIHYFSKWPSMRLNTGMTYRFFYAGFEECKAISAHMFVLVYQAENKISNFFIGLHEPNYQCLGLIFLSSLLPLSKLIHQTTTKTHKVPCTLYNLPSLTLVCFIILRLNVDRRSHKQTII